MTLGFAKDELNFLHFIMEIEFIFCLTIRFIFLMKSNLYEVSFIPGTWHGKKIHS